MNVRIELAYDKIDEIRGLFTEYTNMLLNTYEGIGDCLKIQNYDDEVRDLNAKYGLPMGRLYVIYCENNLAGCIALRKINDKSCEMKRLYIKSEFQGKHLGDLLVQKTIAEAREIGYKHIFLDTVPGMTSGIGLYKKYGFVETDCYSDVCIKDFIYMKLDL